MKLAALLLLAACGGARMIQVTPTGGTLELHGDRVKAMESASSQMDDKCGKASWAIVDEVDLRVIFRCNGAAP